MVEDFPLDWTHKARHFFLIRHPARVIASYGKTRPDMDRIDIGFANQLQFFDKLVDETGKTPPVIDSFDILADPEKALASLCAALNIPFNPAMLSWSPGLHPQDGIWARYWYKSVINSTGFKTPSPDLPNIESRHQALYEESLPLYEKLKARKLTIL